VMRGRERERERASERERERERERKEQKENGMLKGTERGKFIFCFKEAENEKGADAPVEGERKSKTFAPAGNRTRGERMGTVHFTTKPLAHENSKPKHNFRDFKTTQKFPMLLARRILYSRIYRSGFEAAVSCFDMCTACALA
jgi:hypothetical protein